MADARKIAEREVASVAEGRTLCSTHTVLARAYLALRKGCSGLLEAEFADLQAERDRLRALGDQLADKADMVARNLLEAEITAWRGVPAGKKLEPDYENPQEATDAYPAHFPLREASNPGTGPE